MFVVVDKMIEVNPMTDYMLIRNPILIRVRRFFIIKFNSLTHANASEDEEKKKN
jgi:hypothetical protein